MSGNNKTNAAVPTGSKSAIAQMSLTLCAGSCLNQPFARNKLVENEPAWSRTACDARLRSFPEAICRFPTPLLSFDSLSQVRQVNRRGGEAEFPAPAG